MNDIESVQTIEKKIQRLKAQLLELGPMRPGSVSPQYNVCGKPGCRCKDAQPPRRHGPYHQLNYVYQGKKKSQFIRRANLKTVRAELATHKKFRKLTGEWIGLALRAAQLRLKSPA
jgi:hypothetical protein